MARSAFYGTWVAVCGRTNIYDSRMNLTCRHYAGPGRLVIGLLLSLGAGSSLAQGWFGHVGAEIDDADGYVVSGAVGSSFSERTDWDVSASRSDTSTNLTELVRTAFRANIGHDFGAVRLRLGLGGWGDEDFVQTRSATASFDLHNESWSFAILSEFRNSDFDPIDIDRTIIRRDGSPFTIRGIADCDVDDVGLGARLSFSSDAWYFTAYGMSHDYDDFGCNFDIPVLDVLRSATRDEFVQLADRATDFLSLGAGRRLLADMSLLDSSIGTRLSYSRGLHTYTVSYDRVEDVFFGRTADTLTGGIGFLLSSGNELEIYVGLTDSDAYTEVVFLGISLFIVR